MPTTYAAYSFKIMGNKKVPDLSAGKGWFWHAVHRTHGCTKTDMAVIRNRGDPKRFYKRSDQFGKHDVQVGTVIEGSAEYYSSRLTKRRGDLAQEIMADPESASYAKRKYLKITHERQATTAHFH